MSKLASFISQRARLAIMIDFLNELASSPPSDQSALKLDLLAELERLRFDMEKLQNEIIREQEKRKR